MNIQSGIGYHPLPSVRGDLLQRLGRLDEERAAFTAAAALAANTRERALLERRAASCADRAASTDPDTRRSSG